MRRRRDDIRMVRQSLLIVVVIALAACTREPLTVEAIQIGRSLNSDNSVATHTTRFGPKDTMYASVITPARGAGTLTARWMVGGRALSEQSKDVSYNGRAATEFHFSAADGFPPGEYSVEILLDGTSAGTRTMRVE
jgi:hypothetical protein